MNPFTAWTSLLIAGMLVCCFCGMVAYGGTSYAVESFRTIPAMGGSWPPYAMANQMLHMYCGTRLEPS